MIFGHGFFLSYLLVLAFTQGSDAATRIYYSGCAKKGITCVTNANKKIDMTYECPSGVDDVAIFPNQFSAPSNIESFTIKNCKTLTMSTRCSGENRSIPKLQVINIGRLIFQRLQYQPMVSPIVVFENISQIDVIPTYTFGQINKSYFTVGCTGQSVDFQNVYFRNATIDIIESNAFVGLNEFNNFSLINVKIKRIQTFGIRTKHSLKGSFEIRNSVIEFVEYLGIQTYGKRSVIADNHFTEIASSGINGTMEDFYFTKNFVETLQPHGLSILATNIFILDNNFLQLKSSALEKLSPGLLQDSGRNFGKLKFVYDFSKNSLNFLDAASLHPDYTSYENVLTEMMFSRNKFLCTCENLGWLFSQLGHGVNTVQLETFYEMVLNDAYGNTCDKTYGKPCDLHLSQMRQMIACGKCLKNVTLDKLCDKISGVEESATALMSFNSSEPVIPEEMLTPVNHTSFSSVSSIKSSVQLFILYIIIVINLDVF